MVDEYIHSLLSRYGQLIRDCDRHRGLGWYPSGGEVYKLAYVPTAEAVDRFADHLFGGIGFEPPDYWIGRREFGVETYGRPRPVIDGHALERYTQMCVNAARKAGQAIAESYPHRFDDWLTLLDESQDFGGIRIPITINQRRITSTRHALNVGRRAIDVSEAMRKHDRTARTLVEIGGGHGRTTRDLVLMLGIETAYYVDLPLNMLFAAQFLRRFFGDRVNVVWSEQDAIVEGGINIVAPWLIDRIGGSIDLLVNFLSFQHMSIGALRFYSDRLIEPRAQSVFQENRDRPRESHDMGIADYPFRNRFRFLQGREVFVATDGNGQVAAAILQEFLAR